MARPRRSGSVEDETASADLTSMLDLIFNVLAFFVVTFNPPKPEKNFDVTLPPPKKQEQQTTTPQEASEEPELFEDVTISLRSGPGGSLQTIVMGSKSVGGGEVGVRRLVSELNRYAATVSVGDETGALEAATIVSSPDLKYRYLIAVVDACYQARIQKINFAEAAGGP